MREEMEARKAREAALEVGQGVVRRVEKGEEGDGAAFVEGEEVEEGVRASLFPVMGSVEEEGALEVREAEEQSARVKLEEVVKQQG